MVKLTHPLMQNAYTRLEHAKHATHRLIPCEIMCFSACKPSVTCIQEGCNVPSGDLTLEVFALLQLGKTVGCR